MFCDKKRMDGVWGDFVALPKDAGEISASPPPPLAKEKPDFDGVEEGVVGVEIGVDLRGVVAAFADSVLLSDKLRIDAGETRQFPTDNRTECFNDDAFPRGELSLFLGVVPLTAIRTKHTAVATTVFRS